jgi:sorting nexin-9/18/33
MVELVEFLMSVQNIIDIHDATLGKYKARPSSPDEGSARCETVLNTTMAEFDVYHAQKVEDFQTITAGYLDSEIELHEQVIAPLFPCAFISPQFAAGLVPTESRKRAVLADCP